jgi:hypothetical protein
MRPVNMFKAAVAFVVITFVFMAAVPSAQAVGTHNRKLRSVGHDACMRAESRVDPLRVSQGSCSFAEARWWVRVRSDSYNGTGREHWQIENASLPGACIKARNVDQAELTLGSCQYSGNYHTKFEVFRSVIDGNNNVYQLKDTEAFENFGKHRCIVEDNLSSWPLIGSCNVSNDRFNSYWDAIGW